MPDLAIAMRTAPRKRPYVHETVDALLKQGVPESMLHVWSSAPDCRPDLPVRLHRPSQRLTPNETGIALVGTLDLVDAPWLLMLEDDLEFCADFAGSVMRWLDTYASAHHVYRFCAFGKVVESGATWAEYPLREQRGSQAIALRADDARAFATWATAHSKDWRPAGVPFQKEWYRGFDKLVGYWALATWPHQRNGLVSRPQFVRHVGLLSGFGGQSIRNDTEFAGAGWRFAA